jgi:PAS domain S-box-containing protein
MLPDFRVRQRDYLLEIARALTQELDLETLLDRILHISEEMLAGQAGIIALRESAGKWRVTVSHSIPKPFLRIIEPLLSSVSEQAGEERSEIPEINRILKELTYSTTLGFLTGVGLPLIARQKVIGVIFIFRSYAGKFSANDQTLLSSFANQAAVAVHNAQLYSQVSEEKQRMDALLDSAADGILILGPDRKVERGNPAFNRLLGQPQAKVTGKMHEELIRWSGTPQGMTLEEAERGGWPLTPNATLYVEGDLIRDALPTIPVGITYAPLMGENGTLLNIFATLRDITRFRQAEELKSTFFSVISHELKTPVALIKGYVGTLRREDAEWDPKIIQDSLQVIEEETDHLTGLIENLLDASRLQAGAMALKHSEVCLPDLVEHTAERLRTQTNQHTIVVDIPEDFPMVVADEERLRQVLSNLISNALKYSDSGEIRVSGQSRPDQIILCVSDQGPGIAAADIPHVFDRFYRAPDAMRLTKGAGLGLYLARSIIEAHGGRIWVDPRRDHGARICFSLPRS